jgi:hypothetical protein
VDICDSIINTGGVEESRSGYAVSVADKGNWRYQTRERRDVKFCDRLKAIYLEQIEKHGKRTLAALHAGVSKSTVSLHLKEDPEFQEAFDTAYDKYREARVRKLETQAMNGFEETIFGPTGERSTRKRYESNLRAMVLKAHAPEMYAEKSAVDITVRSGVMLAPATLVESEWEAQFRRLQDTPILPQTTDIPATGVEVRSLHPSEREP